MLWPQNKILFGLIKLKGEQEHITFINISFRYAHGVIARSYQMGQTIEIQIDLVANHLVSLKNLQYIDKGCPD